MMKRLLPIYRYACARHLSLALLPPLLAGCSYYFDTGPERKIAQRVEQRLNSDEQLSLAPLSKTVPLTIEQALPKFKERRPQTDLSLPSAKSVGEPVVKAQPKASKPLSISQVRTLALENNLDLKIAQIDPKIAATGVSEEQAKFDDLIFARAKYGTKNTPAQNLDVVTFTSADSSSSLLKGEVDKLTAVPQRTDFLDMDAGIVIPLRTGAKMTISVPFDEKRQFKGVASDQYLSALRFSISQPLLRDGGIDANVAGIRIARYEQQAVDVKTRLQAIRVLAAVERGYWGLYVAWGELDVRRQQYENAADNLVMVKKRVAAGLTAAVEINRAEIGVAERMEGLIVSETTLKLRQRQLKLMMNDPEMDLDTPTVLIPETTPMLVQFTFNREQLAQRALQGRLELLELELKLAADLTKIDYLSNQTLPLFMLDYNYASLGRDSSSFGGAFDQTLDGNYSDWSVGLRIELPLTNELRRARRDRSIQQRLQRLTTLQLRELSVRREIYDALDQLEQNWQRILAARQNVLLAGLNYDAELKQFREGLRTMTEVLETLTRLGDAQLREVRAIGDYQISMIDLAFATGTLLGHSRVDWAIAADGS
ncbi:MAG: TolC family protein [Methylobacter sp.]|nr:TolC family protein [Methylobacter sp.]MDO9423024.1 TolC family protein [Methylobacter sp.]